MNDANAIRYIARAEAARCTGAANPRDVDSGARRLPLLKIYCVNNSAWRAEFEQGAEAHPAAYRAPGIVSFLQDAVFPRVPQGVDISGEYRFELHDAVRRSEADLLLSSKKLPATLGFARNFDKGDTVSRACALFPDDYQLVDYRGLLAVAGRDAIPWSSKRAEVIFAGTTTGSVVPADNRRVQACLWALGRPGFNLKLTSVCQMSPETLAGAVGLDRFYRILGPYVEPAAHFAYRYVLNIEGNTCCWSRVPMILASRSLMVHLRYPEGTWYYPLLHASTHYVEVETLDQLPGVLQECEADPERCQRMVAEANSFARRFCTRDAAAQYVAFLLQELSSTLRASR